jgi:hypothetical protein
MSLASKRESFEKKPEIVGRTMLIYDVYRRDYKNGHSDKIAVLVERRRNPNRQDGLRWARAMFGEVIRDAHAIFVIRREENINIG